MRGGGRWRFWRSCPRCLSLSPEGEREGGRDKAPKGAKVGTSTLGFASSSESPDACLAAVLSFPKNISSRGPCADKAAGEAGTGDGKSPPSGLNQSGAGNLGGPEAGSPGQVSERAVWFMRRRLREAGGFSNRPLR